MSRSNYIDATVEDALSALCEDARKKGAKGIINISISYTTSSSKQGNHVIETIKKIHVSGMAIKW